MPRHSATHFPASLTKSAKDLMAPLPKKWRCQILNVFGIHDEVGAAAKEIVRLVDDGRDDLQ